MAFVARKTAHRSWPVTFILKEYDAESKEVRDQSVTVIFLWKLFNERMFDQLMGDVNKRFPLPVQQPEGEAQKAQPKEPTIAEALDRNAALFEQLIGGWLDVIDDDGNALPFSAEELKALITGPDGLAITAGLSEALGQIRFGNAPRKNSEPSPAPGQEQGAREAAPTSSTTTAASSG